MSGRKTPVLNKPLGRSFTTWAFGSGFIIEIYLARPISPTEGNDGLFSYTVASGIHTRTVKGRLYPKGIEIFGRKSLPPIALGINAT